MINKGVQLIEKIGYRALIIILTIFTGYIFFDEESRAERGVRISVINAPSGNR